MEEAVTRRAAVVVVGEGASDAVSEGTATAKRTSDVLDSASATGFPRASNCFVSAYI